MKLAVLQRANTLLAVTLLSATAGGVWAQNAPQAQPPAKSSPVTSNEAVQTLQEVLKRGEMLLKYQENTTRGLPPLKDGAEARAAFAKAEAERKTLPPNSLAFAETSARMAQAARFLAWKNFEQDKNDESAGWFARYSTLQQEAYQSERAFYVETLNYVAPRIEKYIRFMQQQQDAAKDEDSRRKLQWQIDSLPFSYRYVALAALQNAARPNGDVDTQSKYAQQELELRQQELAALIRDKAPDAALNPKKAAIAGLLQTSGQIEELRVHYPQAEKLLTEALALRRQLPADLPERQVFEGLKALAFLHHFYTGDFARARAYYLQALQAFRDDAPLRQRDIDQTHAEKLDAKGNQVPDEALTQYYKIGKTVLSALDEVTLLKNIGSLEAQRGDYRAAQTYYDQALKAPDALPPTDALPFARRVRAVMRASTLKLVSELHLYEGMPDQALKEMQESQELYRNAQDEQGLGITLTAMTDIYWDRRDIQNAEKYAKQAQVSFAAAQNTGGLFSIAQRLSTLAAEAGRGDEAEKYGQQALKMAQALNNKYYLTGALDSLAYAHIKQNRPADALPLLAQADDLEKAIDLVEDRSYTLRLKGQAWEAQGKQAEALEAYKQSIQIQENVRATAASESGFANRAANYRVYEYIVQLLIKMGRSEEAFEYLNRAKSKQLQDTLRLSSIKTRDKPLQALLDKAGALQNQLQTAQGQLQAEQSKPEAQRSPEAVQMLTKLVAQTQGEFYTVTDQLKKANPNYDRVVTIAPKELKRVQRDLPADVAIVEYAPLGEQLYIFLVTRDGFKIYTPPGTITELYGHIREARQQIVDEPEAKGALPVDSPLAQNLTALYDKLIAPLEADLAAKKTIAFVPSQLLYYLPMQALAKKQGNSLRYLIEGKQVVCLTAGDALSVAQKRDEAKLGSGLLALGDPTGAGLPFAREEVNTIARVFPNSEALSGADATKAAINAPKTLTRRILHFATHGVLNQRAPEQSYIYLAKNDKPGDEQLTLGEVEGMALDKVDLVTLSACQTVLGMSNPDGKDIASLAEAFARAGAATVIASLWSVADDSTKELMVAFYTELANGKSKAAALQSAELKLLHDPKFARPFCWAPFVLMGDWR